MKKIWVNGCFDVIHRGHIDLLEHAKSHGDLYVGIDSDERVKNLKGSNRPINNENDRKKLLSCLSFVKEVFIYNSEIELKNFIKNLKPDILIVGSDWKNKKVVGSEFALETRFFDKINGLSSTSTLEKEIKPQIVKKAWGKEIIFVNNPKYCGKLLVFDKNKSFSMHYHLKKEETWYVSKGSFDYKWIDLETAEEKNKIVKVGDIIHQNIGHPHQLQSLEQDSTIFEVSTEHFDYDSYRIRKGDSQE